MKKKILLLTNSNIFTVFSGTSLKNNYNLNLLNLRFPNEEFTKEDHFANQVREVFNEYYHQKGVLHSRYYFSFNDHLVLRLSSFLDKFKPDMIFIEMQSLSKNEWSVLDFLSKNYNKPLAAFIADEGKVEKNLAKLAQRNVKEIFTQFEEDVIHNIVKRNIDTQHS